MTVKDCTKRIKEINKERKECIKFAKKQCLYTKNELRDKLYEEGAPPPDSEGLETMQPPEHWPAPSVGRESAKSSSLPHREIQ